MKTYNGLQAVYMSFFSKDLYRCVVQRWKGLAFLYLFVLIMAIWTVNAAKIFIALNDVVKGPVERIIVKLPNVEIKNGELQMDKPSPYILKQPKNDTAQIATGTTTEKSTEEAPLVRFDATTDDISGEEGTLFLVTKHYFYVQSKNQSAQQYPLKSFGDMALTKDDFRKLANQIAVWVPVFVLVIVGPVVFLGSAIAAVLFGAIAMALGGAMNTRLTYGESVRIASVALTPAILVDFIVKLFNPPPSPIWMLVSLLLVAGYTVFGVMANKGHTNLETSMPGGMPQTTTFPEDDLPPTDNTTPMA